jgi:hypothetical protein
LFPPSQVSMLIHFGPSIDLRAVPLSSNPGLTRWSDGRKR